MLPITTRNVSRNFPVYTLNLKQNTMSTRGSIGIFFKGEFKDFYNHSDSYPSGLGEEVVAFVKKVNKTKTGWDRLKKNLQRVVAIDRKVKPTAEQIENYKEYADLSVSNQSYEDWYCLLRRLQGIGMIQEIMKGKLKHANFGGEPFIKDSLFCEYAYVINLDKMTLEFYEGFQDKKPQKGNRFGVERNKSGYYPCRLNGECKLKAIPTNWMKKFYPKG